MRVVFHLSEPGNYFPIYERPVPIELFRLDEARFDILFDQVYGSYREFFPEAPTDVIGRGGLDVISAITDKCDLLNIPSDNLFTKVFVFSAFCSAMGRTGFCLFHPGNHFPEDMEILAPAIRSVMKDPVASAGLVFYSFTGKADRGLKERFYLKKGESMNEGQFLVREICKEADIDAWKKDWRNKDKDPDEVFFPGSGVFSFNPVALMESLTAGNEELLSLYHLMVKSWEDGSLIGNFLKEAVGVLDGFDFLEMVKGIDDKYFVVVGTGLYRADSFGDLLGLLPLNEDGNFISGDAETRNLKRSAVINRGDKKIVVSDLKEVLVLSNGTGTGVRSLF